VASSLDANVLFSQITEWYIKLPLLQKIVFPLLLVGSVMGTVFVARFAHSPEFSVLYSDLDPADSAAVLEKLKALKVSYEIRADGKTIAVTPSERIPELRISLAADGIPKSGKIGLEIFDGTYISSTVFQEKVRWLRAVQGELERTISAIDVVSAARVHITQPEKTVFTKNAVQASASVLLRLKPGGELDKKQIKGIANLVAGSVEGLTVDNVTIVDVKGNLLTVKEEQGEEQLTAEATRLQYQRELERGYVGRVEQMLSKVIGADKVIARVTAELDFSSSEKEEESYDPGSQVVRSERTVEEGVGGNARGGVPGVVSNLTNDTNLIAPNGATDKSNRKESVKNYEVTRAITKSTSPRGKLSKISVAVLVDGTYEAAEKAAPDAPKIFKPLAPEVLARVESLVKSAVGFDASRGDTVTVENIPFFESKVDFTDELKKQEMMSMVFQGISKAGPFAFMILFFFVVIRPLVKFLITPTDAEVDLSRLLPSGIAELEKEVEAERQKAQVPAFEPSVDLEQLEELMKENSKIVKENPHQAALLIRYWLNDGRL
jgi:flagellar M-ring protein FliF